MCLTSFSARQVFPLIDRFSGGAIRRRAAAAGLLLSAALSPPSLAAEHWPGVERMSGDVVSVVTVRGEATAPLEWKDAVLRVAVERRAPDAAEAFAALRADLARLAAAIEALGVPERAVRTEGLTLAAEERNRKRDDGWETIIVGHRASAVMAVRMPADAAIGAAVDALAEAGANRVLGVGFEPEDPAAARVEALGRAVEDARARAEAMAAAAGRRLGDPVEIVEQSRMDGPMPFADAMRSMALESAPATPVFAGEASISVSVHAVWRLEH